MANALNLKSKNVGGFEESKGAESEEEYATTAKLSKGVAIEVQMRLANNLRRSEEISSSSNKTSKELHVSGMRKTKANDDELLLEEGDMNDLLSRKFEDLLVFQRMKSFEDCESPVDPVLSERGRRGSYRKAISLHSRSMPRQSNFGNSNRERYDDDRIDDWEGMT